MFTPGPPCVCADSSHHNPSQPPCESLVKLSPPPPENKRTEPEEVCSLVLIQIGNLKQNPQRFQKEVAFF